MQAALFKGPLQLEIVDFPLAKLGKHDLLIRVQVCGICGTDIHIYSGQAPASPPVILGHEYTGEILEKGSEVSDYQIGDNVAIDPNIYCGFCKHCRRGRINLCENLKALGVNSNGGFAELSMVPASQAYILPKDFPLEWAAFAEPLSCCLRGIQQASIHAGDSVAILGAGPIGLLMLQLAQLSGASRVIQLEPIPQKQETASHLGADFVFGPDTEDVVNQVKDITAGGPDVVIECVGHQKAAVLAVKLAKPGGRIIIFGLAERSASIHINLQDLFHRELTIKGSLLNPFTFQAAVDLLVSRKIQVEPLNPVSVKLSNISEITSKARTDSVIKYQVLPNI